MPDNDKNNSEIGDTTPRKSVNPLVFISHDSRDADLAEAFSKLLRSVSAGMLKSFRSSDKKGNEGIEFGDEWYKRLMERLDSASDVVCLFTKRSIARPWILYEAGVAKGKLNKPVLGLALGVSLSAVGTGPFFQFQNSDDSEDSLVKLLKQLAERVQSLDLDPDVVKAQVHAFREKVSEIIKGMDSSPEKKDSTSDSAAAKIMEEMKVMIRDLPGRIDERGSDGGPLRRRRRMRRLHPMLFDKLMFVSEGEPDSMGLLIMASLIREDFPWMYEIGLEAYRMLNSGSIREAERLLSSLERSEKMLMGGLMEEYIDSPETEMMLHDSYHMLHHIIQRAIEAKKRTGKNLK